VLEIVSWLGQVPPAVVYLVAAALIFAETGLLIGLVLPGEVTLIFVGFLASLGTINPVVAASLLIAAGLAGDALGFREGRRLGPVLQGSRLGVWVGPARWERAESLLNHHRGRAVFLGRYVAFVRTLMPRLCAMAEMPYRRFLPWDVLGVSTQVIASVAVGYLAGDSYQFAAELLGRATGASLLLVLVIIGLVAFGRYLGKHPDPVTAFGDRLRRWGPLRVLDEAYDWAFRALTARVGVGGAVAVSIVLGVVLLLGAGVLLTMLINLVVSSSGIPLVDPLVADWFAAQRSPGTVHAAAVTLAVLRGSFLVVAAGIVGLVLNRRPARWRADLLGVLGTVGAFLPLLILAAATEFIRPERHDAPDTPGGQDVFANQLTVVTASVGLVAWLLSRSSPRWGVRVASWVTAVGVVLVVASARLYLGWNWPSEVVASILLGALWVLVFAVAWRTRDRLRAADHDAQERLAGSPRG